LKKQYEDCGKNMIALGNIYNITANAVKKWFVKYEKDLGITNTCLKQNKPKSVIKKPTGKELLHDKNVLNLNVSQIAKKYNVDRKTVSCWLK
jgi:transposase-like protein